MELKEIEAEFIKQVKQNYPNNADKIIDAYHFAKKVHEGVKRKSGEPYIIHPLLVAKILIENNMDYLTVMAGLLHDVVEDTPYSVEQLEEMFGETVAKLVDGVTKIDGNAFSQGNLAEEMSIQKLILSMGTDIRVILIKLADRLHNMRTIDFLSRDRQIRMAKETIELFIPIAERLGIRKIRSELDELTFKCLHPEEYADIKKEFDRRLANRKDELKTVEKKLNKVLKDNNIDGKICAWPEHYYSIYKKIKSQGISKVYGLMLYKLIIEGDELDCYKVMGILHKNFRHLPAQIKDFISSPKPNGYRSLHTVLISDSGDVTFKVMIRTTEMDKICESGVSSVWNNQNNDEGFNEQIEKYNKLKDITSKENISLSPTAFINAIKSDLFSNVTWVFTPKLKPICLSSDKPTVIDFAYAVHTDIGHQAISAVINGKKSSLASVLKSGDIVEVKVSETKKAPSRNWLMVAQTAGARQKINKYLKDHSGEEFVKKGKLALEKELKKFGHSIDDVLLQYPKIEEDFGYLSHNEMFASIGNESVTVQQIVNYALIEDEKKKFAENVPVEVANIENFSSINYPKCCSAVPGDKIVAVANKNNLSIHRDCCKNISKLSKTALIPARWKKNINELFSSNLKIVAEDRVGLGAELLSLLAREKVNLNRTNVRKTNETTCEFELGVQVKDISELEDLAGKLKKLSGVKSITRIFD